MSFAKNILKYLKLVHQINVDVDFFQLTYLLDEIGGNLELNQLKVHLIEMIYIRTIKHDIANIIYFTIEILRVYSPRILYFKFKLFKQKLQWVEIVYHW